MIQTKDISGYSQVPNSVTRVSDKVVVPNLKEHTQWVLLTFWKLINDDEITYAQTSNLSPWR